jgi:hypothetical protein
MQSLELLPILKKKTVTTTVARSHDPAQLSQTNSFLKSKRKSLDLPKEA